MNLQEMQELAQPIVEQGYKDGLDNDSIKMNLMVAKIPFSKLNSVLKTAAIELGLLVDPKQVTDGINEKIEACDWESLESWGDLAELAEQIADSVEGATAARVTTLARSYCKNEMDLLLPKKPRTSGSGGKGRVGAIAKAVVELLAENNNPTKQEFYDALTPVVGGDQQHANILYYIGLHQAVGMAIAQGTTLEVIAAQLASKPTPEPGEGVSAVPRGSHAEASDDEFDDEEMEEAA